MNFTTNITTTTIPTTTITTISGHPFWFANANHEYANALYFTFK